MALGPDARRRFLAEPHVAALSVAAGADRGPLAVSIWYRYPVDGELWVLTPAASEKAGIIEAAGRVSVLVQRVAPTVRYVGVEGPVTRIEPGGRAELVEMAGRYLPPEQVPGYVAMAEAEHGPQVVIGMRPERWISADLG